MPGRVLGVPGGLLGRVLGVPGRLSGVPGGLPGMPGMPGMLGIPSMLAMLPAWLGVLQGPWSIAGSPPLNLSHSGLTVTSAHGPRE